jgi:membrane-bound serine protease (ClpP class)
MKRMRARSSLSLLAGVVVGLLLGVMAAPLDTFGEKASGPVVVVHVESVINPITAEFIEENLKAAAKKDAALVIIQLDTPGGLDTAMREIVKNIFNSQVPVVVYVAPSGARAASAGVFITMAADVAAMAPGTNIGAAHPVAVGGKDMADEMAKKVENDAVAYIKSIASKRNRNVQWAEQAVRKSVSITAEEALRLDVIDLVAQDLDDLLSQLHGGSVLRDSKTVVLDVKGRPVEHVEMGWRHRILNALSNPNVAYILLMIGLAGLYFELAHPGAIFPGVIGGISLILAFYALHTLPINYAGVMLILLGIVFFLAELKVSSYGLLTIAGIVSLTLGSIMLFDAPGAYQKLAWKVLIPTVLAISGFFAVVATLAFKAYVRKPITGTRGMVGEVGKAMGRLDPQGKVFVHGEIWNAVADEPIEEGEEVEITQVEGLTLRVKRKGERTQ